jgi:hypothetical protein
MKPTALLRCNFSVSTDFDARGAAYLCLVRSMRSVLISALTLFGATWASAQQEPPEAVFYHSSRELSFQIPPDFQLVKQERRYLNPAAQEVPSLQRMWQRGDEGIIVQIVVEPKAVWESNITHRQRFEVGLAGMLSDPAFKVLSRRSYELNGCPAESVNGVHEAAIPASFRMDCFQAKPNMFIIGYMSAKSSSWGDPASRSFFESISLKPKQ